jgi:hypothetical protein
VLHRAFVFRAAFILLLGIAFHGMGTAVFERTAHAQFREPSVAPSIAPAVPSTAIPSATDQFPASSQPLVPEIPDQHRRQTPAVIKPVQPIPPSKLESAPLVAPVDPRVDPISPKIDQSIRSQVLERHSEQLNNPRFCRKLEQRRQALRMARSAGPRSQR